MATCAKCGDWAGVGRSAHAEGECRAVAAPVVYGSETDELVAKLTPVLMKAARRAGLVGAFTLIGVSIALGVLVAIARAVL